MIVDSHCHVWETWPYAPSVPDPAWRGRAEQVLYEMDRNDVDRAVIICAAIGENPRNADYAFDVSRSHADRFTVFPDFECRWSQDAKRPGAARRLEQALSRWDFAGFTHYPDEIDDCRWFTSEEGKAFFDVAAEHGLLASLSVLPHQMAAVVALAGLCPTLSILCHHHAFMGPRSEATAGSVEMVLAAASRPNIFIKLSGMGNVAAPAQEFPYSELQWIPKLLQNAFGFERLLWGSDYPVSRRHMTYSQTLSLVTRHTDLTADQRAAVLGGTIARLLDRQLR